jgi:hypothetical protein
LTNRKQCVHYGGIHSKINTIECGVPQGSVLGPLLFIIYTNDLTDTLHLVKLIIISYHTTLCDSSPNIPHLYETMDRELDSLTDWFRANKLSLNVSKTNYNIFPNINPQEYVWK